MIEVFKFDSCAILPTRANSTDAGLDLYSLDNVYIPYNSTAKIRTGIGINIPPGHVGKIEDRSSLAAKSLRTGGGVIDAGYAGEVQVILHNVSNNVDRTINVGDKIAQLLIYRVDTTAVMETQNIWTSDRGQGGFGSTGR